MRYPCLLLSMLSLSLVGCQSPTDGAHETENGALGILEWRMSAEQTTAESDPDPTVAGEPEAGEPAPGEPQPLVAPDTVQAGVPFEVQITTIGPNGCWSAGDTEVVYDDHEVLITPYDVRSAAEICTEVLLYLDHSVELTLPEAGEYTLHVHGRRVIDGRLQDGESVTVTQKIQAL